MNELNKTFFIRLFVETPSSIGCSFIRSNHKYLNFDHECGSKMNKKNI